MNAVAKPLAFLLEHRAVLSHSVAAELRYRTAGTSFGLLWLMFGPILLLLVYSMVYLVIFRVQPQGMTNLQYVVYLFCGLVPFIGISEGVTSGLMSLSTNATLLRSTVFPAALLPARAVFASQTGFIIGLSLLVIVAVFVGKPSVWWLLLPVIVALQVMWLIGVAWILSVVNLVFRDLQQLVAYALTLLMVLSPIAYTLDMLPGWLRPVVWFNPVAHFVLVYQRILMLGESPSVLLASAIVVSSFLVFAAGFFVFSRAKQVVGDYV